jgi:o-succinylbenzoate synthase
MLIERVELRVVRLPFVSPFVTSYAVETEKVAVLVTVWADGVEGYGEGVMDPQPIFREETIAGALGFLRDALIPNVLSAPVEHPDDLGQRWATWRGNPMARACLEMAIWDAYAKQLGEPLCTVLGGSRTSIPVGASLGIAPVDEVVASVGRHLDQGYQRVKLKIMPGADIATLSAVRSAYPAATLSVDANSAYTLADAAHLRSFDQFELKYVEQPLHWDDLVEHAALAKQMATPICLDESLTSDARVAAALELGAVGVVNLKVGRVGGHSEMLRIHQRCAAAGVPMWCGGMLETGIGRAHNIHLATLPGFTMPGDTASASRTYARDLVEPGLEAINGYMPVPSGPGIGVTFDRPFLESVTASVETYAH